MTSSRHVVAIEPPRVDLTNLPRLVGARRLDALPWLTNERMPRPMRRFGERHAATKVRVARRVARAANRDLRFDGMVGDVADAADAAQLTDCDFLFLAADTMQARLVVNALVQQFLIPAVQVGAKVQVDKETGTSRTSSRSFVNSSRVPAACGATS